MKDKKRIKDGNRKRNWQCKEWIYVGDIPLNFTKYILAAESFEKNY